MLKKLFLPINYNESISKSCGEIVCQDLNKFFINCNLCKIKIFDFFEFVEHIRNMHLDEFVVEALQTKADYNEREGDKDFYKRIIELGDENEYGQTETIEYVKQERTANNFACDEFGIVEDNDNTDDVDYIYEEEELTVLKKCRKSKELPCETCGKKYADSKRLKMHITVAHKREKPFKCTYCTESYSLKRSLEHHIGIVHTGYKCHLCEKILRTKPTLNRHLTTHTTERNFVCTEKNCGRAFLTRRQLRDHEIHHKEPELMCEECGFKCYKRESLIVHQRSHTGEKPYACEQCDRRFTTSSLLCEHRASHAERKHVCDVCGKSFNRPKALYHHKYLHLGIKKFVCKICGAAYAQAAGLSAHTRKHREGLNMNVVRVEGNINIVGAKDVLNELLDLI